MFSATNILYLVRLYMPACHALYHNKPSLNCPTINEISQIISSRQLPIFRYFYVYILVLKIEGFTVMLYLE